jgi:Zn-dependent M28 family amino/carboxypeptidase
VARRSRTRTALTALTATSLITVVALATPAAADKGNDPAKLAKDVKVSKILDHLEELQEIADDNAGTRASGSPGYDASAAYVAGKLRKAGYTVTVQEFDFPFFSETSSSFAQVAPTPTDYVDQVDYDLFEYSGAGDASAAVVPIDLNLTPDRANTSGCEPTDFGADVAGKIALMQRGTCGFGVKVANAEAAGAIGAVIMNQGNGTPEANADRYELFAGTLGGPVGIPAVSVSYAQGEEFAGTSGLMLRIAAETVSEVRRTSNVIADSKSGRADNVVMAGAHLDSVPEGAGINDNGSGSAALLEVALQMAKTKTINAVRFAWWGAEEAGLLGAAHYVGELSEADAAKIALYLNFDMIASPNYFLGVYDGDNSSGTADPADIPAGSAAIEDVFEKFYAERGLPFEDTEFSGRSDYGPFIAVGIPAGGLFTGAEGIKTQEQQARYGGTAGVAFDPCYHQVCDNLTGAGQDPAVYGPLSRAYDLEGNVNLFALDVNADAVATAVFTFAMDTSTVDGPQG